MDTPQNTEKPAINFLKQKFLLVDPSSADRSRIESILKKLGSNRVDQVDNGKDALARIRKSVNDGLPYSLVMLEWDMPDFSGLELMKILRADSKLARVLVLIVSSKSDAASLQEIAGLKPQGFVVKPYEDTVIIEKIESILRR